MTFDECLRYCMNDRQLVREYDRLNGTNLSFTGTALDLAIDQACKRQEGEFHAFAAFVFEAIWRPLLEEAS